MPFVSFAGDVRFYSTEMRSAFQPCSCSYSVGLAATNHRPRTLKRATTSAPNRIDVRHLPTTPASVPHLPPSSMCRSSISSYIIYHHQYCHRRERKTLSSIYAPTSQGSHVDSDPLMSTLNISAVTYQSTTTYRKATYGAPISMPDTNPDRDTPLMCTCPELISLQW